MTTKTGAEITERSYIHYEGYFSIAQIKGYKFIYNDGLSALIGDGVKNLISYCEGGLVYISCLTQEIYNAELKAHLDHYNS